MIESRNDIRYFENEDKRVIVAKAYIWEELNNIVYKICNANPCLCYETLSDLVYKYPNEVVAKARCAPEDEWDEDYGANLAKDRLVEKLNKLRTRFIIEIGSTIGEAVTNINRKYFYKK